MIEKALLASKPFRHIAARFGTSTTALQRHANDHMAEKLAKAEAAEVVSADSLLSDVKHLHNEALGLLALAKRTGDVRAANGSIMAGGRMLVLLAQLLGKLEQRVVIDVNLQAALTVLDGLSRDQRAELRGFLEALYPESAGQRLLA